MQSLVVALALTRLDYGNATLARLGGQSLAKLQSVLNAGARLIFLSRKFDHVTPLLRALHWLRFSWRINYKLDFKSWAPTFFLLHRAEDELPPFLRLPQRI